MDYFGSDWKADEPGKKKKQKNPKSHWENQIYPQTRWSCLYTKWATDTTKTLLIQHYFYWGLSVTRSSIITAQFSLILSPVYTDIMCSFKNRFSKNSIATIWFHTNCFKCIKWELCSKAYAVYGSPDPFLRPVFAFSDLWHHVFFFTSSQTCTSELNTRMGRRSHPLSKGVTPCVLINRQRGFFFVFLYSLWKLLLPNVGTQNITYLLLQLCLHGSSF